MIQHANDKNKSRSKLLKHSIVQNNFLPAFLSETMVATSLPIISNIFNETNDFGWED